uniref:LIM zinc-binding domain-containing protein n=1 Tax=Eptatretus burgeri TaxID=7764 RepID=A0A8C4X109_EPTBU
MTSMCASCGDHVYPAEKLECLGRNWHKLCFVCRACGAALSVSSFSSYDRQPYCPAHCPKQMQYTSVLDTPANIHARKQTQEASEIKYRDKYRTELHLDQAAKQLKDPESQGDIHSFPATDTPAYRCAHHAQKLASQLVTQFPGPAPCGRSFPLAESPAYAHCKQQLQQLETRYRQPAMKLPVTAVTDSPELQQVRKNAQLSELKYRSPIPQSTSLPLDSLVLASARSANKLASEVEYRANYEKERAKGGLLHMDHANQEWYSRAVEGARGLWDTLQMQHARNAGKLASSVGYKESWHKLRDGGYNLPLDALTVVNARQARDNSSEITGMYGAEPQAISGQAGAEQMDGNHERVQSQLQPGVMLDAFEILHSKRKAHT